MPDPQLAEKIEGFTRHVRQSIATPPAFSLSPFELEEAAEELECMYDELRQQSDRIAVVHEHLDSERRRWLDLFNSIPDACFITNRSGIIRDANPEALKLFKQLPDALLNRPLISLFALEHQSEARFEMLQLHNHKRHVIWEAPMNGENGPIFLASIRINGWFDGAGRISSVCWILRDITQEKNAERLLLEKEVRHRRALDTAHKAKQEALKQVQQLRQQLAQLTPVEHASAFPQAPADGSSTATQCILLVEDHQATRMALARLLEQSGHVVITAATMTQAMELAHSRQHFDVILANLQLPTAPAATSFATWNPAPPPWPSQTHPPLTTRKQRARALPLSSSSPSTSKTSSRPSSASPSNPDHRRAGVSIRVDCATHSLLP